MGADWIITGYLTPSNSGRSFQVFILTDLGKPVFVGLIQRSEIYRLLSREIERANISKFYTGVESVAQEPLISSIRVANPSKLGAATP